MITVTVDTGGLVRKLADFPGALARARDRALRAIGGIVETRTTEAFRNAGLRPSPWAPRKPSKRDDGHPLLIRSGDLRQSFRYEVTGPDTVQVKTKVGYAGYHQHGTKRMPARPFVPVDRNGEIMPTVMRKIARKVRDAYATEIRNLFGQSGLGR